MYKARILLVLGICMAILPYLGFPYAWKDILFTMGGLILIFFSYLLFTDYKKQEVGKKTFDNFRENTNFNETEV